jgi:hypothetical protein
MITKNLCKDTAKECLNILVDVFRNLYTRAILIYVVILLYFTEKDTSEFSSESSIHHVFVVIWLACLDKPLICPNNVLATARAL